MEYPFDALHAGIESQILNLPAGIPDSQAVRQAKSCRTPLKNSDIGEGLSRQLRYREAIDAYTEGLKAEPENLSLLPPPGGTVSDDPLQSDFAITDFAKKCLSFGSRKAGLPLPDWLGTLLCRAVSTGNGDSRELSASMR